MQHHHSSCPSVAIGLPLPDLRLRHCPSNSPIDPRHVEHGDEVELVVHGVRQLVGQGLGLAGQGVRERRQRRERVRNGCIEQTYEKEGVGAVGQRYGWGRSVSATLLGRLASSTYTPPHIPNGLEFNIMWILVLPC